MLRSEFHRCGDNTVYRFDRCAAHHRRCAGKRHDHDLQLASVPAAWCVIHRAGLMRATPHTELDALGDAPSVGRSHRKQDAKSYEHDLRAALVAPW